MRGMPRPCATRSRRAARFGVAVGAHPSYPDPANFGRRFDGPRPGGARRRDRRAARRAPRRRAPTSATSNRTARSTTRSSTDAAQAVAVADAVADLSAALGRPVPVLGLGGEIAAPQPRRGLPFVREAFLDRGYLADGSLVPARRARRAPGRPARRRGAGAAARARGSWSRRSTGARRGGRGIPLPPRRLARRGRDGPRRARRAGRRRASRCARRGDARACSRWATGRSCSRSPRSTTCSRCARRSRHPARRASSTSCRPRARCWCASTRASLSLAAARAWAAAAADGAPPQALTPADEVVLDIVYDGADLAETAELLGHLARRAHRAPRGRALVGRVHGLRARASATWSAPTGRTTCPASASPRTRVPAGAVGPRRRLHRRLPARDPGRLAAHRHDVGAPVRSGCRVPGAARTGNARALPAGARAVRRRSAPLADQRPARASQTHRLGTGDAGAASASSSRACSRRCRISGGRARHPSASRPPERSTAARCAPRTGWSATPRAPRASRSRWAASAPSPTPTSGSR